MSSRKLVGTGSLLLSNSSSTQFMRSEAKSFHPTSWRPTMLDGRNYPSIAG